MATAMRVDDVLRAVHYGTMSMAAAAADFAGRDWSRPQLTRDEIIRGDDTMPAENDWADVEGAFHSGWLTDEQYNALRNAVIGASTRSKGSH